MGIERNWRCWWKSIKACSCGQLALSFAPHFNVGFCSESFRVFLIDVWPTAQAIATLLLWFTWDTKQSLYFHEIKSLSSFKPKTKALFHKSLEKISKTVNPMKLKKLTWSSEGRFQLVPHRFSHLIGTDAKLLKYLILDIQWAKIIIMKLKKEEFKEADKWGTMYWYIYRGFLLEEKLRGKGEDKEMAVSTASILLMTFVTR